MEAPVNTSVYQAIAQDNKKELHKFVSKLKREDNVQNFTFKALFDFDSLTDAINQVIVSEDIDLIIMGSNGATGIKEIIFGSNTLKVIRNVDCPILVIPENYNFKCIASILLSAENYKEFKKDSIESLTQIIEIHQSLLSVLDLNPNTDEKKNHLDCIEYLLGETPFDYFNIQNVPASMAISSIMQLFNFDLHALFMEPKSFIHDFIFGSKYDDINYVTQVPILVLRP